jgi:hypothetical protein
MKRKQKNEMKAAKMKRKQQKRNGSKKSGTEAKKLRSLAPPVQEPGIAPIP